MKKLAIFGAGGHGLVVAEIAEVVGYQEIHFYDDFRSPTSYYPWPLKGNMEELLGRLNEYNGIHVALGENSVRKNKACLISQNGGKLATLIHPRSIISQRSRIGQGSTIMAGAVVNANTVIGDGVILNTACTVDHDSFLGDFSHIGPNSAVAGRVYIGAECLVGVGATIKPGCTIGDRSVLGAGAVLVRDIPSGVVAVGCPAEVKL